VRTWAPKGQTPVIQFHFNWHHISVIAGLTRTNCLFRIHEGSIKKEELVEFLKALKSHLKQPLLVIWDGARSHHSHFVRDYVDSLDGHIQIAYLPPYAPDLNPVEYLWAWLKRHAMANYCPDNLSELQTTARNGDSIPFILSLSKSFHQLSPFIPKSRARKLPLADWSGQMRISYRFHLRAIPKGLIPPVRHGTR